MVNFLGGDGVNILAIGDVCGTLGCEALLKTLPRLKKELKVDFTIINGENSADSNGISPNSAELLLKCGDVITGGNHTLRRQDFHSLLDENERLLRPDNLEKANYGSGYCLVDMGKKRIVVINLLGTIYLEHLKASNPFEAVDKLIDRAKNDDADIIVVDFHAEATSEKRAMGFYLDGKVSFVFGTHTHVQTSDLQILENGTAYITDLGMTGPKDSVLGVEPSIIIDRLKSNSLKKFALADSKPCVEGAFVCIDDNSLKVTSVKSIRIV